MSGSASFSHVLADLIPWVFRTNSYIRVALMCSAVQWSAVQCSAVHCGGTYHAQTVIAFYQSTQSLLGGHYWAYMLVYMV